MPLTLSETLDNLYTTTWQQMKDTVRDQIYDATPFWFWMKEKGKLKSTSGGRFLTEPLQFAKTDSVQWITKGGTVPLNDFEFLTIAQYDWKYLVGSIVRFGVDDQQNRGKWQIINLMNAKFDNVQNGLIDELETRLFGASGSADDAIDGLQLLVADDPTAAGSPGKIDQAAAANSWWRNQTTDLTGMSFATNGVNAMRTMLNKIMNNLRMDAPDIIVSGQLPYEFYEENLVDSYYRITQNKLGDAGFITQVYKGIPMVWSPACSDQRMYFLNTNFISFQFDPMLNFDMTEWKAIPDQVNDRTAQIVLAGAMTVSRRRAQGVIHTIDLA
ncbi:hypothetical protein LCGC14_1491560 [marine sediment metagenome]|uniref:Phage major capsid protein n=1 Tax=marine sediment metagenome TaxID=412755 RepID=A0A0F9M8B4_9ZZZZ